MNDETIVMARFLPQGFLGCHLWFGSDTPDLAGQENIPGIIAI